MKTFEVEVTQFIRVTVDESNFTPEFFVQFAQTIGPIADIEEIVRHLARLYAESVIDNGQFCEGFGPLVDMGITFGDLGCDVSDPTVVEPGA